MSTIDYTALITAEMKATEAQALRAAMIKADCTAKISDVLDTHTLSNLHSALLSEGLTQGQTTAFRAGQGWVREMRQACRDAIATGHTPAWPTLPEGVKDLAAAY